MENLLDKIPNIFFNQKQCWGDYTPLFEILANPILKRLEDIRKSFLQDVGWINPK